jgi:hypothetical protein
MTARDRWEQTVKCPVCGRSGQVRVSQADGWEFERDQSTRVDHVPGGFEERPGTNANGLPDFYCIEHNVKAD